jgi:hypothetical protein
MGDITIAPYFARMCVLEYYRGFTVPEECHKWHTWKKNVLSHPAVLITMKSEQKIIWVYRKYADCTIRNVHYRRYYERKPFWMEKKKRPKQLIK